MKRYATSILTLQKALHGAITKMSGTDEQKAIGGNSAGNKKRSHDDLDDRTLTFVDRIEMPSAHKVSFSAPKNFKWNNRL